MYGTAKKNEKKAESEDIGYRVAETRRRRIIEKGRIKRQRSSEDGGGSASSDSLGEQNGKRRYAEWEQERSSAARSFHPGQKRKKLGEKLRGVRGADPRARQWSRSAGNCYAALLDLVPQPAPATFSRNLSRITRPRQRTRAMVKKKKKTKNERRYTYKRTRSGIERENDERGVRER